MGYAAAADRYDTMPYRRAGRSGVRLPAIALGLWHNFGGVDAYETARALTLRAFDRGVNHFDLANNYGPPPGSAESTFGHILKHDLAGYRDELFISSKAGYTMWPGPYGDGGSRKYLLASLDQSLKRMGLDYVDLFYSHRPDAETPLEETMDALVDAVRQGKALYVGLSNYDPERTARAAALLRARGVPALIHQPSYSMFNRGPEGGLFNVTEEEGMGVAVFSPLARGLLTRRYLDGIPPDSRAAKPTGALNPDQVTPEVVEKARRLDAIAQRRGQTLPQLALAWVLRDPRVTTALIGASRVEQLDENLDAAQAPALSAEELADIDAILR